MFWQGCKSVKLSVFGSGDSMDLATLIEYFGFGIGFGFVLFCVFSLLGFGIYKALKMLDS